jgi:DNA-binding CsgD family transcriptional regulator
VKNYRHRIYEKFDITTERELFIEYNRLAVAG